MLIGNKSIGLCKAKNCTVAIDSGSTFMLVPFWASAIMNNNGIPTQAKSFSCKTKEDWGNIDFIIGGKKYTITPAEYMHNPTI